jgi:hypothetical protein
VKSSLDRLIASLRSKRGDGILALAAALTILACLVLIATYPWGRDQSIYGVVGHGLLHQQVPYRDLWDFKPPGIFFVYAAAEALFGQSMSAIRTLEALGLAGTVLCMVLLAKRLQGSSLAGWCAGAIAALSQMLLDFWHTAQPETFGGMLTVAALAIVVPGEQRRTSSFRAFMSGALLGAAGLMKPQLAGGLIVFGAYLLRQSSENARLERLRPLIALGGGWLTPVVACAAYFVAHGAWSDFWWTMHDFLPGYTALGWHSDNSPLSMFHYALVEALTKFSAYIPIGVAAIWLLPSAHSREQEGVFLILGLVVFHAVGIAMQAKFFEYHYGATIPLLALIAAMGWAKLWWSAVVRGPIFVTLFSLAVLFAGLISFGARDLPGTAWQRARLRWNLMTHRFDPSARDPLDDAIAKVAGFDLHADRDVAKWMKGQTGPDDTVLVWGFEPSVYWFAQRKPATRFIYNVAQRTAWQQQKARRWFMNDVRKNKPVVVAVQHADIFPGVTGRMGDSAADLADFPEFAEWLRSEYSPAGYRFNFEYFRRRGDGP